MSLLNQILGSVASQAAGNLLGQQQGGQQLINLLMGLIQQSGGIQGVVQKFAANGLGSTAQQWVARGPNPPISGDQFAAVFGNEQVQSLAKAVGVEPSKAAGGLAALLPTVIDQLTPDGQPVHGAQLEQNMAGLLQKGIGGLGVGDLARLFH